jgi:hypothetical protein
MLHSDDVDDNCLHTALAVLEKHGDGLGIGVAVAIVPVPAREAIEVVYDRDQTVVAL